MRPVLVRVVRTENGTPVAGARVDLCREGTFAKTDKDGFAVCPGEAAKGGAKLHLIVGSADRADTLKVLLEP